MTNITSPVINDKQNKKISKFLSLVLRHTPEKIGLEMDSAGWTSVKALIDKMNANNFQLNIGALKDIVSTNQKKRFEFNEDKTSIRASQGHSIEVKLGYAPTKPPATLYHGTSLKYLSSILKNGIDKRSRHHVHLSADKETALIVGRRHGSPIVLKIRALEMENNGHEFYLSKNKVWLTDFVPTKYIVE